MNRSRARRLRAQTDDFHSERELFLKRELIECVSPENYTYFYKGKEYWKFDNQKLTVEPGYPKSILRDWMGCDQSDMERSGSKGNRGDRHLPLDDVDIMVTINDVPTTVNAIAVVIPCILSLCILVLVYTIFQFKNKGVQQSTITQHYYKYPVQEWV
ncbi:Matrix metalloproteinase-24 [Dissostichus eleginoides]|nr:Matrix metalloproteinase-24 [Dissostichus eleginoides]